MAHNSESVEYIDLTPTWESILPTWLILFEQAATGKASDSETILTNAKAEFLKMARAADKWNAHCKESAS